MNMDNPFWDKVDIKRENDCWLWKAACFKSGYGAVRIGNNTERAHRIAFLLSGGEVTAFTPCVAHTCHNKKCCNPKHLKAASQAENLSMSREAMRRPAEKSWKAKLNWAIVDYIRASSKGCRALGRELGVDHKTISSIKRGLSWKDPDRYQEAT